MYTQHLTKIQPISIVNGNKVYSPILESHMSDIREVANFYDLYFYKGVYYAFVIWCDGSYEMVGMCPKTEERVSFDCYDSPWLENATFAEILQKFEEKLVGIEYINPIMKNEEDIPQNNFIDMLKNLNKSSQNITCVEDLENMIDNFVEAIQLNYPTLNYFDISKHLIVQYHLDYEGWNDNEWFKFDTEENMKNSLNKLFEGLCYGEKNRFVFVTKNLKVRKNNINI